MLEPDENPLLSRAGGARADWTAVTNLVAANDTTLGFRTSAGTGVNSAGQTRGFLLVPRTVGQ